MSTINIGHLEELAFNFILEARASVGKDLRGLDGIDTEDRLQVGALAEMIAATVSATIEKQDLNASGLRYTVRNGIDNGGASKAGLTLEEAISHALDGKRYHRAIWRDGDVDHGLPILRVSSKRTDEGYRLAIVRCAPQWQRPLHQLEARWLSNGLGLSGYWND